MTLFDLFARPAQQQPKPWFLKVQQSVVRNAGGTPNLRSKGADGTDWLGRPVEVKSIKQDSRFRINQRDHKQMVREGGTYVFVNAKTGQRTTLTAAQVSATLGRGGWYQDRTYSHRFITRQQVGL